VYPETLKSQLVLRRADWLKLWE